MEARKYFGTDGIRGPANTAPMTAGFAMRVAQAAAVHFGRGGPDRAARPRALIGKDTRLSCYMFEQAMTAGFLSMGLDVLQTGPIPTPAVAMLTRALRAEVGVMISASHNAFSDNGIKLFGADGRKLPDAHEAAIEALIDDGGLLSGRLAVADGLGKATRMEGAVGRYVEALKSRVPRGRTLAGLRVVVDCAHGAAYRAAPQLLWELEAEVITINAAPNGRNINAKCGATHPVALRQAVVVRRADIGLALDGDADRLIAVDERGQVIDGDQVMAALALSLGAKDVVSTVMAGAGLQAFLASRDIALHRTPVGDRHVAGLMHARGLPLGGEPSGHIILREHATTGDGLLAALHLALLLKEDGRRASRALRFFEPMPQVLDGVAAPRTVLESRAIRAAIEAAHTALAAKGGRVLVRPSGTEALIRVMAEAPVEAEARCAVDSLCEAIGGVGARGGYAT